MNGYSYNPVTGEFVDLIPLRESPLEAGVHLVPAHCTTSAPPEAQAGFAARWSGRCCVAYPARARQLNLPGRAWAGHLLQRSPLPACGWWRAAGRGAQRTRSGWSPGR